MAACTMPRTVCQHRNLFGGDALDEIWCETPVTIQVNNVHIKGIRFDDGHVDYIFLAVTEENTTVYSGTATPALEILYKDLFDPHLRRNKPEGRDADVHRLLIVDAMTMLM